MPNQLKMSKIQSIIALRQQGWSFTRIARELGIHRQTVADRVREHSKPTEAPTGSEEPKPTKPYRVGRFKTDRSAAQLAVRW